MKVDAWFVGIVDLLNVDKMNLIEKLDDLLAEAYMKGPASFIVMNDYTSYNLMREMIDGDPPFTMHLAKYENLEVLISQTLADNEFRIG